MNEFDMKTLLVIFLVSLGTYLLRVSGLLLSNKLVKEEKIKLFLDYLPATLLLSLIVPSIIKEGFVGVLASIIIVFSMYKTENILLSMCLGICIVAISRNIMF